MFSLFKKPPPVPQPETVTLAQHRSVVAALNDELIRARADLSNARNARDAERRASMRKGRLASELLTERDAARSVLRHIAALETPGAAFIGRKMARMAREGLPEFAGEAADRAEAA